MKVECVAACGVEADVGHAVSESPHGEQDGLRQLQVGRAIENTHSEVLRPQQMEQPEMDVLELGQDGPYFRGLQFVWLRNSRCEPDEWGIRYTERARQSGDALPD